ncbi:MAG TPA: hypothetical protein VMT47_16180 [Polyangia bacterium]|nr:hypothetical protein [Polyangia bacterium]
MGAHLRLATRAQGGVLREPARDLRQQRVDDEAGDDDVVRERVGVRARDVVGVVEDLGALEAREKDHALAHDARFEDVAVAPAAVREEPEGVREQSERLAEERQAQVAGRQPRVRAHGDSSEAPVARVSDATAML